MNVVMNVVMIGSCLSVCARLALCALIVGINGICYTTLNKIRMF